MGSTAEQQASNVLPPRRGKVWAVTVDSTARAYDLSALALADSPAPEKANTKRRYVFLALQAETNDVYFYFDSATGSALADGTTQAAGAAAVTMANAHCAILEAGASPMYVRIDRTIDKFIQVKAASTSGVLRMWASSSEE